MFCKQQVAQLRAIAPRVHEKGAEIVVVGHGSVQAARRFVAEQKVDFPVLTDPTRRSYGAAGLRHGLISSIRPSVMLAGFTALREGFRQGLTQGRVLQQGGAFVFAPGGGERFAFISDAAGSHADPEQLVAALD